jgi:hypothetical protein
VMRTLSGEAVVVLFFVGSLQLVSAIFGWYFFNQINFLSLLCVFGIWVHIGCIVGLFQQINLNFLYLLCIGLPNHLIPNFFRMLLLFLLRSYCSSNDGFIRLLLMLCFFVG